MKMVMGRPSDWAWYEAYEISIAHCSIDDE